MPIISIPTFATGDTIEASWANDLRDNGLLLDSRTGGDPGAANKPLVSSGATAGAWATSGLPTAALADLAVTTAKLADLAVTTAKLGDLSVTNGKVAANTISGDAKMVVNSVTGNAGTSAIGTNAIHANRIMASVDAAEFLRITSSSQVVGTTSLIDTQITTGKLADGAVTPVKGGVPSGAVVWFALLSELTAAGAAWARYTAADGRMLVGAGASASAQTFVESTNYGSTWTPAAGIVVTDTLDVNAGSLDVGGSTDGTAPTNATGTAAPTATLGFGTTHVHTAAGLTITGLPNLTGGVVGTGQSTVWVPYMRAGIWGRKV